jgi:threonine/homoserine/homoserine lactone efflux protein
MTLELWFAFVLASSALLILPGPTILLVLSYALAQGRRSALPTVVGVALGDLTALTLSLVGLGAVLAASATAFTLLKWFGALYLIWLGVRLWRAAPGPGPLPVETSARSCRNSFGRVRHFCNRPSCSRPRSWAWPPGTRPPTRSWRDVSVRG